MIRLNVECDELASAGVLCTVLTNAVGAIQKLKIQSGWEGRKITTL